MKKEFVPLTSAPQYLLQTRKINIPSNRYLIKHHTLDQWDKIQKIQLPDLTPHQAEVTLIEEEGQVRAIHFKCPCGCQAAVQIVPDDTVTQKA